MNYGNRAISVVGLIVFQFGFWVTSRDQWRTVIVGLFVQQAIALFVLKSGACFHTFKWPATLAPDFVAQGFVGTAFFDLDIVNIMHWFFANVVCRFAMTGPLCFSCTCSCSSPLSSSSLRSCRYCITSASRNGSSRILRGSSTL